MDEAHQHAADADDWLSQGLLVPAAREHADAADAFLRCHDASNDPSTKRTLRMLYNDHLRASRDLHRRIAKLREENKDPALPQLLPERTRSPEAPRVPPPSSPSPRLVDSQNNVDESFLLLGQRSDPGDAFNDFWRIMEGMLDNLSQPVAFATAPLGTEPGHRALQRDPCSGGDIERDAFDSDSDDQVFVDQDDQLSESFCLVPFESDSPTAVLKKENLSLKHELDGMQRRLAEAERVLQSRKEQDQLLRDSIVMARHQAQRAMGASLLLQRPSQQPPVDLGALNINIPSVPAPMAALNAGRDRETQLLRRIRDLEEDLRVARAENDKQKVMIARFRERWDKLKESAKRKKDAKAAADPTKAGVRDRIEEEPDAEQELDGRA